MGNMMRRGKVNPSCKCCNDSECDGYRTREKREWVKDHKDEIVIRLSEQDYEQLNDAIKRSK